MRAKFFFKSISVAASIVAAILLTTYPNHFFAGGNVTAQEKITQGTLQVLDPGGTPKAVCPLKHTEVKAEISGFLSRVTVTQQFENPFKEKIEAVYTFPLPQNAAVDDMTMLVGDETVRGKILQARRGAGGLRSGQGRRPRWPACSTQERPNIFTQSVANILPGEQVKITISYVETLKYEDGSYEFVFPMVVGPRYVPGNATGAQSTGLRPTPTKCPTLHASLRHRRPPACAPVTTFRSKSRSTPVCRLTRSIQRRIEVDR